MNQKRNSKPDPPDLNDILALVGMGGMFFGVFQWSPPGAYVLIGTLLFVIAIARARSRS